MQDQPSSNSSSVSQNTSASTSFPAVGHSSSRSVASRLKSMKAMVQGGVIQNGNSAGPEKFENGAAHGGESTPMPSPVQLLPHDVEVVRLIGQHLKSLGMNVTVNALMQEARCTLELPAAARFRMHVLEGNWDMVVSDLKQLQSHVNQPSDILEMKFLVLEQKYLEFLEKGQVVEALGVLQGELTSLNFKTDRVHDLSSYLMFNNTDEQLKFVEEVAGWAGSDEEARQKLLERLQLFLPPSIMMPPKRLHVLLQQALQWQYSHCPLHNTNLQYGQDPGSLLIDHRCNRVQFPCEIRQCLTEHCDEVWCALFSHSGKYLATGAKDSTVFIWECDLVTKTLKKIRKFEGHQHGAAFFAWSPDDRYLAVVGADDGPDLWLWNVEKGELRVRMSHSPEDSLSAVAWHKDGSKFVTGGQKGQFYHCDLDGNVVESWEGIRIRSLWCKKDGRTVLAADTHHRIRAYTFDDLSDFTLIREQDPLIFFCLDASERYALCTTKGQGLHMWDLEAKTLVKRFRGSNHGEYVVVSCFGGENQDFVATGSEDGRVFMWHRSREDPVKVLSGHTSVVNAVTWNPVDPSMLVSCSDDGTLRVWGPEGCGLDTDESGMEFLG